LACIIFKYKETRTTRTNVGTLGRVDAVVGNETHE